jgi:hypothetical protein
MIAPATEAERCVAAEVVIAGTVIARADPAPAGAPLPGSGDPVTWTFQVVEVAGGRAGPLQAVVSARGEASCGHEVAVGGRYAVFADTSPAGGAGDGPRRRHAARGGG